MDNQQTDRLLQLMIEQLELPDSAYEKAVCRYEDLGAWLCREESTCSAYDPYIFPQGSFRLGTAIRPLDGKEEYDLDLACELKAGITKETHTQEFVKQSTGDDIETFRVARGIKAPREEKHRCWRLYYSDQISFHMDVVPSIPEAQPQLQQIREAMVKASRSADLASTASATTVSITDDRHPRYRSICGDWNTSNPEGYARWFEAQMRLAHANLAETIAVFKAAQIDDVPVYKWKTPLQRVVQLLKRHRDQMFRDDPEVMPVSIIITTLAGRAYQGEADIQSAMSNTLARLTTLVNERSPRIPNPVDPAEDFADGWARPECRHLRLEENFWRWVEQARSDFALLTDSDDAAFVTDQVKQKYALGVNADEMAAALGLVSGRTAPKVHVITGQAAKPWRMEQ